jgi:hypothetical protein
MLNRFPIFRAMASVMIGLALFLTTGGHLAILQGVAWTNMVRDFAKTDSIGTALEKTFAGQHPCTLCKKITETGSGKKDDALASAKSKLGEFLPQSHRLLAPPCPKPFHFPTALQNKPAEIFFAPPVPIPISVG